MLSALQHFNRLQNKTNISNKTLHQTLYRQFVNFTPENFFAVPAHHEFVEVSHEEMFALGDTWLKEVDKNKNKNKREYTFHVQRLLQSMKTTVLPVSTLILKDQKSDGKPVSMMLRFSDRLQGYSHEFLHYPDLFGIPTRSSPQVLSKDVSDNAIHQYTSSILAYVYDKKDIYSLFKLIPEYYEEIFMRILEIKYLIELQDPLWHFQGSENLVCIHMQVDPKQYLHMELPPGLAFYDLQPEEAETLAKYWSHGGTHPDIIDWMDKNVRKNICIGVRESETNKMVGCIFTCFDGDGGGLWVQRKYRSTSLFPCLLIEMSSRMINDNLYAMAAFEERNQKAIQGVKKFGANVKARAFCALLGSTPENVSGYPTPTNDTVI